jgi:putative transposase
LPPSSNGRRRIDRALFAVAMDAYLHSGPNCKVDDLVAALGATSGMSKSDVSRTCGGEFDGK